MYTTTRCEDDQDNERDVHVLLQNDIIHTDAARMYVVYAASSSELHFLLYLSIFTALVGRALAR